MPLRHTRSVAVEGQLYLTFSIFSAAHATPLSTILETRRRFDVCCFVPSKLRGRSFGPEHRVLHGLYTGMGVAPRDHRVSPVLLAPLACRLRIAVTLAEIGVIAYSSLRYLPQTPFPGLAALAPCVGSALVLVADESGKTLVGTVFPWWPVVFIGLITCSLCL